MDALVEFGAVRLPCGPREGQEDANGRPATLPDPHGMSGTAVWRSGRVAAASGAAWSPDHARIVGIVHTWDQQTATLVATRIEVLRDFIRDVQGGPASQLHSR
ncbi:MAG: hypothetical protein ACK4UN_08970 [Limisphaerales bacterium]